MNRLQSIQLATDLKDECLRVKDCSKCKCRRVCDYYLEIDAYLYPIIEMAQIIREVDKGEREVCGLDL